MVYTLYKLDASPPSRAAMMIIEHLQMKDVEYIDVMLPKGEHLTEEYLKINPQHTIPTLKDDDFVVWDSHAIALYLLDKYGDRSLYPSDLKEQATVNQRLHFDTSVLFPAMAGIVGPIIYKGATAFTEEGLERVRMAYEFSEKFLEKKWFAGDKFTVADICAVASISSIDGLVPVDAKKYPKLKAWLERCTALELVKKVNGPGAAMLAQAVNSRLA